MSALSGDAGWTRLTKRCNGCGETLSVVEFHAKTRWPSGEPRTWQSRCKQCHREADRRRLGHRPKRKAPMNDIERAAARRESRKRWDETNIEARRERHREQAAELRAIQRADREGRIDVVVALFTSKGYLVRRRRTKLGTTTRLIAERVGDRRVLRFAYPNAVPNWPNARRARERGQAA